MLLADVCDYLHDDIQISSQVKYKPSSLQSFRFALRLESTVLQRPS